MFERYTEKARRVIFFARYEASQFGSPYIETEHLLLGLLREDKALANRFLRSHAAIESIRKQIEAHPTIREKVSTSVDLPLSHECKRVLAYGAEEAERLNHKHIGTEHLLLGLLREEKCFAAEILHERGLRLSQVREEIQRSSSEKVASNRPKESSLLAEFSRDLTQAAIDGSLDPLIGRDYELERVVQILCRRTKNNPVLIGEPGVGKTAIVEGLAQKIADGDVPSFLSDKRILALDLSLIVARCHAARSSASAQPRPASIASPSKKIARSSAASRPLRFRRQQIPTLFAFCSGSRNATRNSTPSPTPTKPSNPLSTLPRDSFRTVSFRIRPSI